jgi:hypothetical protein
MVKKVNDFPELSLDGNNLIITVQGEFGKLNPGRGWENGKLFYSAYMC